MSFKTILVPVGSPEASKSTLNAALLIAKRWNSHLEILHVRADPRGRVLVEGEEFDITARPATERERAEIWAKATAMYSGYEKYQSRVGAREIPILVLEREN